MTDVVWDRRPPRPRVCEEAFVPKEFARLGVTGTFQTTFEQTYARQFPHLFRFLDRLSGDRELAADLAQEAFVRLYRRGTLPDAPDAWLATVALNLFRNLKARGDRRLRILHTVAHDRVAPQPAASPEEGVARTELQARVQASLATLPDRERSLLLLRAEGYSYADMALALDLNPASVGTLLARAKRAFRSAIEEADDAS